MYTRDLGVAVLTTRPISCRESRLDELYRMCMTHESWTRVVNESSPRGSATGGRDAMRAVHVCMRLARSMCVSALFPRVGIFPYGCCELLVCVAARPLVLLRCVVAVHRRSCRLCSFAAAVVQYRNLALCGGAVGLRKPRQRCARTSWRQRGWQFRARELACRRADRALLPASEARCWCFHTRGIRTG